MKEMDCVEIIVEKEEYIKDGVHKGMQGWVCLQQRTKDYWLVNFPQYGEKEDIAEISIREEDLVLLPNGMDAKVNEQIKAKFGDWMYTYSNPIDRQTLCLATPNGLK